MPQSLADAARGFGYEPETATPLPHPWGLRRTFRVSARGRRSAVLKSWEGDAAVARLQREVRHLEHLEATRPAPFARLFPTPDGRTWLRTADGLAWSGYEYVAGRPPRAPTAATGTAAGRLLGALHEAPQPGYESPSRLDDLERVLAAAETAAPTAAVGEAAAAARAASGGLRQLPRACIHGDFNLENILVADSGPVLIDFEFARWDLRLFDFAALAAPLRRPDGSFLRAPDRFLAAAASAYDAHAGISPLTLRERRLFGVAALVHALFIVADLGPASPFTTHAHSLLASILQRPPRL